MPPILPSSRRIRTTFVRSGRSQQMTSDTGSFSVAPSIPFGDEEEGKKPTGILPKLFGNIETAPILTIGSGRPVNPLVGSDANHSGEFPLSSRPLGLPRNTLRTGKSGSTRSEHLEVLRGGRAWQARSRSRVLQFAQSHECRCTKPRLRAWRGSHFDI